MIIRKVLGINKTTTADQIKSAYRKLAVKYHPDKNKSKQASQLFIEVNEAYAYLSNEISSFQTKNIVKAPNRKRSKYSEEELKKRMDWARKYAQYKKIREEKQVCSENRFKILKIIVVIVNKSHGTFVRG